MPRRIRPDWECALHHIMVRGIDGKAIFTPEVNRIDLVNRFSELVPKTGTSVYAWAIMPNHFHILVRTGDEPISRFMHRLLTGYAISYNLRNERKGHVFQGRFKSILVQEEVYFVRLVKYIHLNPLKAHIVDELSGLRSYKWCGHGSLLGVMNTPWQDTEYVLSKFRNESISSENQYLKYLNEENGNKDTEELISGNYLLGKNGITDATERKTCDLWSNCCRVLGNKEFALSVVAKIKNSGAGSIRDRGNTHQSVEEILEWAVDIWGFPLDVLQGSARSPGLSDARAVIACICSRRLGLSQTDCAVLLRMSRPGVRNAIKRGEILIAESEFIRRKSIW